MNKITNKCLKLYLSKIIDTFNFIADLKPTNFIEHLVVNDIDLNKFTKNKKNNEVVYLFNSNNKYTFSLSFTKNNNNLLFTLYFIRKDIIIEVLTIQNTLYVPNTQLNNINFLLNQTKYIKCYNYYYKLNKTNVVDLDNVFIKVIELLNKIFKITCIRIL